MSGRNNPEENCGWLWVGRVLVEALCLVAEQEDWPDWSAVPAVEPELDLANCGKMRLYCPRPWRRIGEVYAWSGEVEEAQNGSILF